MEAKNNVARIKELISKIKEADDAYYGEDDPIMSDKEYDALMDELKELETVTGIVFANSPSKRVGGRNKEELKKVAHTKPMLSARKTKLVSDVAAFAEGEDVILSRKMDGLSVILRYADGRFIQAITRGEDGLVGEDVTHTVRYFRNVPKKVGVKQSFEVRGEGVLSWTDFRLVNKGGAGHPRSTAAGLVRTTVPDRGNLSHVDFIAFELILPCDGLKTKKSQLDFLSSIGFDTVEHITVPAILGESALKKAMEDLSADKCGYPVDGIIVEYNDVDFGKSLGATAHHENRMLAFKWTDEEYETVFRGVELSPTRSGMMTLTAKFDPVTIDGAAVDRAELHSVSNFESLSLGVGDRITVYKANMIVPQIAGNLTESGTYVLPERCPCCGSLLETKRSASGTKNLFCPNPECIARSAQKIARFCDKDAMNMDGFSASVLEKLMAYGLVGTFADLYELEKHRDRLLTTPGIGFGLCEKLISSVNSSRHCRLAQFLVAVGIPLMGPNNAKAIDEYFRGSWDGFEKAIKSGFSFFHIEDVSQALSNNIYKWYNDENEAKLWRPVLKHITFTGEDVKVGEAGNPFLNATVVVTGTVNGMNRKDVTELLELLGASVKDAVTKETDYLIVGTEPGTKKLSAALSCGTKIITEGHFSKMLADSETDADE